LAALVHLEVIRADRNRLTAWPPVLLRMPALRELHLGDNAIDRIPEDIDRLTSLEVLCKQLVSLAAAYALIKEALEEGKEPIDLEFKYINKVKSELNEELVLVEEYLNDRKMFTFKQFSEEGEGAVAANNAAVTPGIAGLPPDQVPISKKRQKKWVDSNSIFRRK
jgi:hypothetical protein